MTVKITMSNADLEVFMADEVEVTLCGPQDEIADMLKDVPWHRASKSSS